ncbi:histidinol-phosphate transaminase [Pseudohongiella sp.]|uniref:Aminotransferase class I/classII large domain-containing protein n=1 Tax=marine sediment metagenome TaxID=412755 RepID=A0A0F9W8S1_9ZZZZ|nr:histidinol-phosphate transaminase [Pseudohongiella sp.]HDZ08146.1 histidinol-phosphate transaminase [Pseudohongiella sp.]HEA63114.1 histidinol-phosphate transaminase [Pseudohongiella sp.]
MTYERANIRDMAGYTWGEQPAQKQVIKLNTNENPYPATASVADALKQLRVEELRRYPQPFADGFRDVAAAAHGVARDNIMATNGGDELLRLAITTFVDAGQTLGMAEPSYSLYPVLAAVQGCRVSRVNLNDDWSLPQDFAAQLNAVDAKLAFVVNPHAPTGQLLPVSRLREIAAEFKGVLVIDEAYVDFIEPAQNYNAVPLIHEFDNVMFLRTMSKGFSLAGLRFAYGIGSASLLAPMLYKTRDSYNTDALSQHLATAALAARDEAAVNWQKVRDERARLGTALTGLGFAVLPSESNFLLITVPLGSDSMPGAGEKLAQQLYQGLKDDGILIRYFDQPRLRDKLRITVGTAHENTQLLQQLESRLEQARQ